MPLVAFDHLHHAYGHLPLLEDATLQVDPGERVAVIGRNGAGKSTLLRILAGELAPDRGTVWRQPGTRAARLEQDVPLTTTDSVFDVVAGGLGDLAALVRDYHHAAVEVARTATPAALARLGTLQHELEERDGWRLEQRVELVLSRLALPADAAVDTLSGGWRRRVLLARALVAQPDLLLLDEPTNHLDVEAIEWLEAFLTDYTGTVVFVTHDRAFLERLATRIVELDRGRLTSWPGDFAAFVRRKEAWLDGEAAQQAKFDKKLAEEEAWLRQGIKARRTRNEGRVRALLAMRKERAARRAQPGKVRLQVSEAEHTGQVVFEAEGIGKSFGGYVVVRDFSTRIMRGDRVGLIGPNGSGKTTLLRMLMGEIEPDTGEVRRGSNVRVAYFDQQREQLDPERTVADTLGDGSDTVEVNGQRRHVLGYLQDFLFPAERARSPVKALSGGERNRLLLACLFTRPANVLVLDEPTNDLDLDTLELLEAQLVAWPGTLLLVSHDRRFLDNVITSTLAFEGNGRVEEYVGGYGDWRRQRDLPGVGLARSLGEGGREEPGEDKRQSERERRESGGREPEAGTADRESAARTRKPSFKERREFEALPAQIEALEAEQARLSAEVVSADFYKMPADHIHAALARLEAIPVELEAAYARWDELDTLMASHG